MKRLFIALGLVATTVVIASAVALTPGTKQVPVATAASSSEPQMLSEVPATLPPEGVMVNPAARILLVPPPDNVDPASLAVQSAQNAIEQALPQSIIEVAPSSSTAILAVVTIGATVPPPELADQQSDTISNRLCWVVTSTYAKPIMAVAGPAGPYDYSKDPSAYASHFNILLDAQTGDLIWGFFTK